MKEIRKVRKLLVEENNIYEKPEEIVISFRKIWDNFIRYWWICLITVGVAILGVVILTLKEYNSAPETLLEEDKKYQAVTMVYMEPEDMDLEEYIKNGMGSATAKDGEALDKIADSYEEDIELSKNKMRMDIEQWFWNKNNQLMYDSMALLKSSRVIEQINNELEKNKMEQYDIVLDKIEMKILDGSRCFTITVRGEDEKRTELIANTATSILIKEAKNILGIVNSKIIDNAVINLYRETENLDQPYEVITEESLLKKNEKEDKGLSIGSFVSMKKLLLIFVGGFLGLGVIFVFVLMDKKIRTREEMGMYFNIPFLGEIKKKDSDGKYDVIATAIVGKCKTDATKAIMVASPKENDKVQLLTKAIEKAAIHEGQKVEVLDAKAGNDSIEEKLNVLPKDNTFTIVTANNLDYDVNAIRVASKLEKTIVLVKENADEIGEIEQAVNNVNTTGGKVLGYVLNN